MSTVAWKYILINSLVFAILSFILYFTTSNLLLVFIGWVFLGIEIKAAFSYKKYLHKEEDAPNNI